MTSIAIDPGITTGVAIHQPDEYIYTLNLQIPTVLPFIDGIHSSIPIECLIIEPFRTAGRLSSPGLATIDLVGQLKGWAFCNKVEVRLQTPQSRKAWTAKAEAFFKEKHTMHELDALAHLLQYLDRR